MSTIEERLSALESRVALLEKPRAAARPATAQASPATGIEPAGDSELDGQYGDPEIRKDPPRWSGESFAGRRFSQTSPEYLDNLAGFKMWSAKKDDDAGATDDKGRPKSHWAKKDAALALGWARRLRDGYVPRRQGAAYEAAAYGTTGHGASAKHGEPEDMPCGGPEDDIPF